MIRYVLHPGTIPGGFSGGATRVDFKQLASLYGVKLTECAIAPDTDAEWATWIEPVGAIHLRPRSDGNYQLP